MAHCPKCDSDISESYQGAEPDVGIMGAGWYCDACDLAVDDDNQGGFDDDVVIGPAPARPDGQIGTPISELSGRPGHPGFAEFCRIAKTYGHD